MKNNMVKIGSLFIAILFSFNIFAAGYSGWAIPTQIEVVSGGVTIFGDFGDPHNCGSSNRVFVSAADPFYDSVLTIATTALVSQRELKFYSNTCVKVSFHHATANTNQTRQGQAFFIK